MINTNGFWLENTLYVMGKESSLLRGMYRPTTDGEGRLKTVPGIRTGFIGKFIMKIKVIMLSFIGLILSGHFLDNEEIKFDDIWNFKISVTEMKGNRKIHLTGLLGNSAMGISDSKITIHDDELNIVLFETLAKGKYSGDLNKEIIIEKPINKITFGSNNKIVWQD